jgi:ribonuclease HI
VKSVFTSELSTIFMALVQIRDHHPGEFIILSDSMSSLRALQTREISRTTHSLVYEIKEASWWQEMHGIHIMWIPSHVSVMGNELADRLAGEAVQGATEFIAPVRPSDF